MARRQPTTEHVDVARDNVARAELYDVRDELKGDFRRAITDAIEPVQRTMVELRDYQREMNGRVARHAAKLAVLEATVPTAESAKHDAVSVEQRFGKLEARLAAIVGGIVIASKVIDWLLK